MRIPAASTDNQKFSTLKRRAYFKVVIFYDGECLFCDRFIRYFSMFDLPDEVTVVPQSDESFKMFLKEHPKLAGTDSIFVLEIRHDGTEKVRIKADAMLWIIGQMHFIFKVFRIFYLVAPFLANWIYDLASRHRKKFGRKKVNVWSDTNLP